VQKGGYSSDFPRLRIAGDVATLPGLSCVKVSRNLVDLVVFSLPYIEECMSVEFCIPSWNRSHVVGVDE
jgi:hypothetical protein